MTRIGWVGGGALWCLSITALASDAVTAARAQLDAGDAAAAYALLAPLSAERAGDVDFDYVFGIAALDTRRFDQAVLAFERVLAVQPLHLQARAELARAYFLLGDDEAAKQEFARVLAHNPPPAARATIEQYLAVIARRMPIGTQAQPRMRWRTYVDTGIGYDSNANSATTDTQVFVPILGGLVFNLDESTTAQSDRFLHYALGGSVSYAFSERTQFFGSVNAEETEFDDFEQYEVGELGGHVGVRYARGRHQWSASALAHRYDVVEARYRDALGATLQWLYAADPRHIGTAYVSYTDLHYPQRDIIDADQLLGGLTYGHVFNDSRLVAFTALYGGEEEPEQDRPAIAFDLYGVRLGGQFNISPRWSTSLTFAAQNSDYKGEFRILRATRSDERYDATLGMEYGIGKHWTVKPQIAFTRNDSNIVFYDFERTKAWLAFRYELGNEGK